MNYQVRTTDGVVKKRGLLPLKGVVQSPQATSGEGLVGREPRQYTVCYNNKQRTMRVEF